jgi:hypothetical protein
MAILITTLVSAIFFIVAAWYLNRLLAEKGVPKGMTRGFLVVLMASFVSLCAGEAVDWAFSEPEASIQEMK